MARTDVKRILLILGSTMLVSAVLVATLVSDRSGYTVWDYATGGASYMWSSLDITDASAPHLVSVIGLLVGGGAVLVFGLGMSPTSAGPGRAVPSWQEQQDWHRHQQHLQQMPPPAHPGQP